MCSWLLWSDPRCLRPCEVLCPLCCARSVGLAMLIMRRAMSSAWAWGRACAAGSRFPVGGQRGQGAPEETRTCLIHAVRNYARIRKRQEIQSQLDDLPPTMLKKSYIGIQLPDAVDDVVKRLLSLEMASQNEKLQIKIQQLIDKVKRSPIDTGSTEAQSEYIIHQLSKDVRTVNPFSLGCVYSTGYSDGLQPQSSSMYSP
ncbi:hypothetical protein FKM82_013836 [Ascaphus truei]